MNAKKDTFFTRRGFRIALAAFGVILTAFFLLLNSLLAPLIRRKIEQAVIKSSDSLYRVSFSKLEINIFTGEAELTGIRLTPQRASRRAPAWLYQARVEQLLIKGARPIRYWFTKKLELGQITLIRPALSVTRLKLDSQGAGHAQTLYQKLSKNIKSLHLEQLLWEHAQLKFVDRTQAVPETDRLDDLNITDTDLLIDSATQKDTTRTLYSREIAISIRNFEGVSAGGNYQYKVHSVSYSTRNGRMTARGLALRPLPVSQFMARTKDDRFSFTLDSLVTNQLNYGSFMLEHFLNASKLVAYKGSLGIYSNPNGPLPKTDRIITFPNYIIRQLKTHFAIDTLDISGFDVNYTEFNKKSKKPGTLTFKNTKARFVHISNERIKLAKNPLCAARLSTLFMGAGRLDLSCTFNLTDKVYAFQYTGHLGAMNLMDINPLVMPLALGKVKSGQLQSLDFSISGNQRTNAGTVKLLYKNLDIALLDRNYHLKPVKTLLANALVVKANNPDDASVPARFAKVVFLRPMNYPFFRTLWSTLLSGIKPCAGVGYAVNSRASQPLSAKEQKARRKALKKALKEKKKADKQYQKQRRKLAEKTSK